MRSLSVVRVDKASCTKASLNRRSSWRHWALLFFPCPSASLYLCLFPTPLTCRFLLRHFNISKYIDYKFSEVSQDLGRLLDCRSKLLWARQYASSDALPLQMGGFPHLIVRLAPLVDGRGFPLLRSTIVKETADSAVRSLSRGLPHS